MSSKWAEAYYGSDIRFYNIQLYTRTIVRRFYNKVSISRAAVADVNCMFTTTRISRKMIEDR